MALSRRPLRLLHVVDSLERGGLERVVVDLAIAQRACGDEVAVFSILETQGFRAELEQAGIPVIVAAKRRSFDLGVLRRLRRAALAGAGIDIVHAHNFVPNYYAAAALVGAARPPALVGTCHDMGTRLANRRLRWLYRWSLGRTVRVAMVGRQVHDRYVSSGLVDRARATTVRNGIPVERFGTTPVRRAAARATLGLGPEETVIGCVGRLVEVKNHRLMIAVMPALVERYPSARLVLLGGGPLREELQAQAHALDMDGQVVFAGERPGVSDLLPAFDLFAMPSISEGLSIALLEACATGLAVVATAVGGNPEIVADAGAGLLVPAGDANALREAVGRLLGDAQLRARFGDAGRQWALTHASMTAFCESYDALYREAIAAQLSDSSGARSRGSVPS